MPHRVLELRAVSSAHSFAAGGAAFGQNGEEGCIRVRLKEVVLKWIAGALKRIFCRLSPEAAGWFGRTLGDVVRILDIRHRRIARFNLRMAFGASKSEIEIRWILKEVFRNIGQTVVEFFQIPSLTYEKALGMITAEHRERLDECLRAGKGVVLVGSHFGNWELMAAAGAVAGYKISAVARPLDDPDLEKIVREIREASGLQIIPRRTSALAIVRKLKRNEIVGILADQNTRKQNVFVDFFGVKAATTPGPALLALKTGAALVPAFMLREARGKHKLIVEKPVEVVRSGNEQADIIATTRKCAAVLEEYVRKYPTQWFWVHRRWRTRPPGEPPLYGGR
ncbi:MAG: lysophospholipid acyltransferase family protein [Candidatus Lindowbacteria bacterium]|nr:lysophospholipid acyltransferase family protein [Candidatus Lindowbacteria bacterium]